MKDGDGKRTFKLGLIVTMSCDPWDSNFKVRAYFSSLTHFSSYNHTNNSSLPIEQIPPNPLRQETPVPHMTQNSGATNCRTKWHLMVGGLVPQTLFQAQVNPPNLKSHHMRTL
ncbi:hypothetical protein O181_068049 [Austropuccinia psidii MF-1]|uniref:Uncharacterized protein n=1 Tax=Austropuccinia psidii MF-1 TaxID=1389203 RepID=A0A9Q3EWJ4_9BASI|nr:hypothetical protein [Austropuccinia psidii MF-1]